MDQTYRKIDRRHIKAPIIFVKGDGIHPVNLLMLVFLLHPVWWLIGIDQLVMATMPLFILMIAITLKQIKLKFDSVHLALGAFALCIVASGVVPIFEENWRFYVGLYFYKNACLFSGLSTFLIVADASRSFVDILRISKCLILTLCLSVIVTFIALPFYYSGWSGLDTLLNWVLPESVKSLGTLHNWLHKYVIREATLFGTRVLRTKGLFLYPNMFAFCLETVIPLIVFFVFNVTTRKRFHFILFVSVIAFFMTTSRGGTLCLLAGLTLIYFLRVRNKITPVILILTIFLSLFILHYSGYKLWFTPQNLFNVGAEMVTGAREDATEGRYMIYSETLNYVVQKPFFGWGTMRKFPEHPGWPYLGSHSSYFSLLIRTGIIGTSMFFLFFGCLCKQICKLCSERFSDEKWDTNMFSVCLAGIFLIHFCHMIVLNIQADLFTLNITLATWGLVPALVAHKDDAAIKSYET